MVGFILLIVNVGDVYSNIATDMTFVFCITAFPQELSNPPRDLYNHFHTAMRTGGSAIPADFKEEQALIVHTYIYIYVYRCL